MTSIEFRLTPAMGAYEIMPPKTKKHTEYYVLKDHNDIYYKEWGPIGPRGTFKLCEAKQYPTKQSAQTDTYCHALSTYNPLLIKWGK